MASHVLSAPPNHGSVPVPTAAPEGMGEPEGWRVLERCYATINARDGSAEARAWRWQVLAFLLLVVVAGTNVWDHLDRRVKVEAYVQPVQVTEEGRLVSVGLPQEILSYEPQDGEWLDMLGSWVKWVRWQSGEPGVSADQRAMAYLHTCGEGVKFLQEREKRERLWVSGKRRVTVDFKSFTMTPSPQTYQVLWEETYTDGPMAPRTRMMTGTFVVGRWRPNTQAELFRNFRGMCVTAFDVSEHPSSM